MFYNLAKENFSYLLEIIIIKLLIRKYFLSSILFFLTSQLHQSA